MFDFQCIFQVFFVLSIISIEFEVGNCLIVQLGQEKYYFCLLVYFLEVFYIKVSLYVVSYIFRCIGGFKCGDKSIFCKLMKNR